MRSHPGRVKQKLSISKLHTEPNVQLSDTTADATCATACHKIILQQGDHSHIICLLEYRHCRC